MQSKQWRFVSLGVLLGALLVTSSRAAEGGINSWTNTNGPNGGPIGALAIDPVTPATLYEAVNELMTRNSPPKLGGEPARTKSEQAGWFPCRYWQLREPPRPRLRSGTPPNLGGEWRHSNSFTASVTADSPATCDIAGGHRPPLQCPKSLRGGECISPFILCRAELALQTFRRQLRHWAEFRSACTPRAR